MSPLLPPDLNDLLVPLKQASHSSALQHFFEQMITLDDRMKTRLIDHVLIQLQKADQDQAEARWVVTLNQYYPYDIGVLSPLFLNLVKLAPGEAIFLSAGVLHAYLQGTGIELMANSDNVLRGGLTPKHIDVGELVKVLTFESCGIDIQTPVVSAPFTRTFTSPAEEFELATIQLGEDDVYISDTDRGGEIILCTQGQSCLTHIDTGDQMDLNKGESLLIPHALHRYDMRGSGIFYRARGPVLR